MPNEIFISIHNRENSYFRKEINLDHGTTECMKTLNIVVYKIKVNKNIAR